MSGFLEVDALVNGAQYNEAVRISAEKPELVLDCTAPVERGSAVSCTATARPSGVSLEITGWSFEEAGSEYARPRADPPLLDVTWAGVAVIAGTVRVMGKVDGTPDSARADVSVSARNWSSTKPRYVIVPLGQGDLLAQPRSASDLGTAQFLYDVDSTLVVRVESGPNSNYAFYADYPHVENIRIEVNYTALSKGSAFAMLHHPNPNDGSCRRSFVENQLRPIVEAHEGLNFESNSHAGVFRSELNQHDLASRAEDLLGHYEEAEWRAALAAELSPRIATERAAALLAAYTIPHNPPPSIGCNLRFFVP